MCLLHDSEDYGMLSWSLKEIAQAVGAPIKLLNELVLKGVLKGGDGQHEALVYIPRSGRQTGDPITLIESGQGSLWYSSRMVEDEHVRQKRGNQELHKSSPNKSPKGGLGDDIKQPPNKSTIPPKSDLPTSSSTSSSKNKEIAAAANNSPGVDPVDNSPPPQNDFKNKTTAERSVEIAVQVRQWESARGKSSRAAGNSPHIEVWTDHEITDRQLREAYDLAVEDRIRNEDSGPISPAFLDVFVAKVFQQSESKSALNRPGAITTSKPWQATWSGILAKAAELGIEKQDGEFDPQFKERVFAAAQMTEQEKSVLRADHGVSV